MKTAAMLSRAELIDIVNSVASMLWLDVVDNADCWNPDKDVALSDVVDEFRYKAGRYGLMPDRIIPADSIEESDGIERRP
jgi:hypothetical protein